MMKARVDQLKCRTAGLRVKECPDLFRFQEGSKRATVTRDPVPENLQDCCRRAAELYPMDAIVIEE